MHAEVSQYDARSDRKTVIHPNLQRIERYLDGRFKRAFIRSVSTHGGEGLLAHTFTIDAGVHAHTVLVLRDFLALAPDRVSDYLAGNDLCETIRDAGETPVVITAAGCDGRSQPRTDVHLVR